MAPHKPIPNGDDWQGCTRPDCCYSSFRLMKITLFPVDDVKTLIKGDQSRRSPIRFPCSTYPPCNPVNMEKNGGMVAVVSGIRDSGLTVTLLDGGNQYTLMPNDHVSQLKSAPIHAHPSVHCASQYTSEECSGSAVARHCDNGSQAADDRYASTYKTMHCNVKPTSPPQDVTEFPPQRPEVIHGHGNFIIGGYGSGETVRPTVKSNNFRGGMVWPDRGSVCASRASVQTDAFANSLRKYPSISPERSTEIVERLISFTQAKNLSRNHNTCPCSPTRTDCQSSKQTFVLERNPSKNSIMGRVIYQPDYAKRNGVSDNSSLRERSRNCLLESDDSWNMPGCCKNNEVRCFKDTARKLRHGLRNLVAHPTQPVKKSSISKFREHDQDHDVHPRRMYEQERESNNSVNMEIQAAAEMESKEILTLPRIVPMQRTIATTLSPIPSKIEARVEDDLFTTLRSSTTLMHACSCKSIQVKLPLDVYLKTSSSSFDLCKNQVSHKNNKRSKSEEELHNIKKTVPHPILNIIQELNNNTDIIEFFKQLKKTISQNKNICQNCRHVFENFDILRRSVSNNSYFREDVQYNFDQQQQVRSIKEKSKTSCNKESDVTKKKDNLMEQPSSSLLRYLDNIDNTSSFTTHKEVLKFSKPEKASNTTKYDYHNVDLLKKVIDRKKWRGKVKCHRIKKDHNANFVDEVDINNNIFEMTEEEIRNLIELDILAFTEKCRINITTECLDDLIEELLDVYMLDLNSTSVPNKVYMAEKIKTILRNRGLSIFQSTYLTNILTDHWEEEFLTLNPSKYKSKTLIVLPNITQDSSLYRQPQNDSNANNYSINEMSQNDIDTNIKLYMGQISNEIDKWLSNLPVPESQDKDIRQSIISYLASDIVDRHKYLELNPSSEISDTSELEHLKYQIFKVIYKFGIGMTLLDHATDLMRRIQSITVPVFSIQERNMEARKTCNPGKEPRQSYHRMKVIESSNLGASSSKRLSNSGGKCCKRETCKRNLIMDSTSKSSSGRNISLRDPGHNHGGTSAKRMGSPSKQPSADTDINDIRETKTNFHTEQPSSRNTYTPFSSGTLFSGGIKIKDDDEEYYNENDRSKNCSNGYINRTSRTDEKGINEFDTEYNQYIHEWVENIPLPTTSAEERMVAKATRTSLYNDILKAVSKLRSDPEVFNNRFLFEDLLDEEIEKIMSNIPQSPELNSKKYILKVKLIQNITDTNELMKSASGKSYKQQLVESLQEKLSKLSPEENENPDILQIYEELQILNLVEDFIICSHYQNSDQIIAEAYKNKLIKRTENFVEELKANHNKALMNIDKKVYLEEILNILKSVSLPSDKTIQEEADEILLSIEIDKWLLELPLIPNDDFVEQLHQKRFKNHLAKQILQVEKGADKKASAMDNSMKNEISQFLGKMPLQQGQSLNINLMVDELVKRLKARPTSIENENKKVAFGETDYNEFSKNLPLCSTYVGNSPQNMEITKRSIVSTKAVPAVDASQQLHNGYYHNISKPLFDDLRLDQDCCNTDLSLQEVPTYDRFNNTRPRSSSIKKDDLEPQWYTLQESRQENPQPHSDIKSLNRTEHSNKSIQAISPSEQSYSRHYHNIAKPLLDDLRYDSKCCNDEQLDINTHIAAHPKDSSYRGDIEPNWHTLQESLPELNNPQLENQQFPNEPSGFAPYPMNISHDPENQDRFDEGNHYNVPEHYQKEFVIPQQYVENTNNNVPYQNQRNASNRMSGIQNQNTARKTNSQMVSQRFPNPGVSPKSYENTRLSQTSVRVDQNSIPHRTTYQPITPKNPNRRMTNNSKGFRNITEEARSTSPQLNQSDVFYKSTDRDGIRQTIELNKTFDANLTDSSPLDHLSGYYQPSVLIPPGYMPMRMGAKKGAYLPEDEDYEEENDGSHEFRCRCVEEMLKSQRRPRYCPLDRRDGYPICLTPPFFYPYFY